MTVARERDFALPSPAFLPPSLRERLAPVCVAVQAGEPAALFQTAAAALAQAVEHLRSYGPEADLLRALAHYVVERDR